MYPDLITPKSHPNLLQEVDYDPLGLMPPVPLPPHPRVFVTAAQLERAKELIATCDWAKTAFHLLEESCRKDEDLPEELPVPADPELNRRVVDLAQRNALMHLLTGEVANRPAEYRERAVANFRLLARAYARWPLEGDARAAGGALSESGLNLGLGRGYDLLAAMGLAAEDEAIFRAVLRATRPVSAACSHRACGNHNTWCLAGYLAVAAALGDRQGIHDALYGWEGAGGRWRYGIIHQLRHDYLADGMHWEGTLGYHFYTTMAMVEFASMMQNLGVDLWHKELPALQQSDGHDLHRAYGPWNGKKCLKAVFDAPFYQTLANGDFSLLHDSGLANIRGAYIWGIIYDKAFEVYGDPKYAWLLNRIEADYPPAERERPGLPMSLNTRTGDLDFVRLGRASYPEGDFSLTPDCSISLLGRHENGCTLFPVHGSAILRSGELGAFMYWGSHCAGHMSPANLHLDINANGRRITDAPRSTGYEDPTHLTWHRSTIAHNTVTVDEASMFPYDFETESIWEADSWRDRLADGQLELFQPETKFKVLRAANENVYPGVRLDRSILLTESFLLDVYRVLSETSHQYDWAVHCLGTVTAEGTPFELGQRRGYRHFSKAKRLSVPGETIALEWDSGTRACILPPANAEIIVASDPESEKKPALGEIGELEPRTTVIVRTCGNDALFLSLWTFGNEGAQLALVQGTVRTDLVISTGKDRWEFPWENKAVREIE